MARRRRGSCWLRNIGISAHIDSGKTTLTERILFYTGRIHAITRCAARTASARRWTRWTSSARRASPSSRPRPTACGRARRSSSDDYNINIIDTPGPRGLHHRGRARAARARRRDPRARLGQGRAVAVDHGRPADEALQRVPRIAFVNKMDRPAPNYDRVADMLKEKLGHHAVKIQVPDRRRGQVHRRHRPITARPTTSTATTARTSARRPGAPPSRSSRAKPRASRWSSGRRGRRGARREVPRRRRGVQRELRPAIRRATSRSR
jgi:small GTP-binding protein